MKHIYLSHALDTKAHNKLFTTGNFNAPNNVLIPMQKALTPDVEIFISINNFYERDAFMLENTLIETIRQSEADGFIVDQIFTRDFHDVDTVLLESLSLDQALPESLIFFIVAWPKFLLTMTCLELCMI